MLDLADLDQRLDRLAHRRAALPETVTCAELTSRQVTVGDLLIAARTEESDIGREQLKAEADVDAVRTRAARDQQRLDNGSVTSAKELESLQSELVSLARRQGDLEDAVLEIMERREGAATRAGELTGERDSIGADLIRVSADRDKALAQIDDEVTTLRGERNMLAGGLPGDLVTLYEKIRASSDGVGAAALRRGRCDGCRVELSTVDLNTIRTAADDLVIRCEECRRILVRVPDSGL
ncbi:MAG TPA: C4-type zinc ribbon domain-containing protein [Sporichthyaceae bacterium]|nr:C4-type zinc ribbon domain-containing protein [Sporichthyaceae bacterium]